jgi:hypothetical protein
MKARPDGATRRPRPPLPSGQPPRPRRARAARGRRTAAAPALALRPEPGPESTETRPEGQQPEGAPPFWIEADTFRETTLRYIDDPKEREAVRAFGRVFFDMAVEMSREPGGESTTRSELRAIQADLRYTAGCCTMVGHSAESCSLDPADEKLARFARKLVRRFGALIESIEAQLSAGQETKEGVPDDR